MTPFSFFSDAGSSNHSTRIHTSSPNTRQSRPRSVILSKQTLFPWCIFPSTLQQDLLVHLPPPRRSLLRKMTASFVIFLFFNCLPAHKNVCTQTLLKIYMSGYIKSFSSLNFKIIIYLFHNSLIFLETCLKHCHNGEKIV